MMGSTMGSPQEFQQLCLFVEKHNIRPVIEDTVPIEKYRAAFSTLLSPQKMGKIILSFR
jgi:zinc-binding alcohol dehydrogenase/oxidoreductase